MLEDRTGFTGSFLLLVAELKHREIKLIPHKQLGVPLAEAESSSQIKLQLQLLLFCRRILGKSVLSVPEEPEFCFWPPKGGTRILGLAELELFIETTF